MLAIKEMKKGDPTRHPKYGATCLCVIRQQMHRSRFGYNTLVIIDCCFFFAWCYSFPHTILCNAISKANAFRFAANCIRWQSGDGVPGKMSSDQCSSSFFGSFHHRKRSGTIGTTNGDGRVFLFAGRLCSQHVNYARTIICLFVFFLECNGV